MKNIVFLFILTSLYSYSQDIKKSELKRIVRHLVKIQDSEIVSSEDLILIADNTDSLFFKSKKIKLYTNYQSKTEVGFCRIIELKFWDTDFVTLSDCQTCNEPSNCHVANKRNTFNFEIKKIQNKLFVIFENEYENREYEIIASTRNEENKLCEIELSKV